MSRVVDGGEPRFDTLKKHWSETSAEQKIPSGAALACVCLFAFKYMDLYTSAPYNNAEFKGMIEEVDKQLIQSGFETGCIINISCQAA